MLDDLLQVETWESIYISQAVFETVKIKALLDADLIILSLTYFEFVVAIYD